MPDDLGESRPKGSSKHRKLTCSGCRRRKSKCDGKHPKCTTCIAYKDECVYDKAPSLAYVRSLEEENQELKNQLKAVKTQAWLSKSSTTAASEEQKSLQPILSSSHSPSLPQSNESRRNSLAYSRSSRQLKWETDISVDDHGSVSFHNSTSAVHEPPHTHNQTSPISTLSPPLFEAPTKADDQRTKQDLVMNATKQKQLEGYAIANTAAKVNLPKDISEELLKYHWCWIHPLFLFVYRPAFTRGMYLVNSRQPDAPDPPYFSGTLLKVIHAHCARFLNHNVYQQINVQSGLSPTQPLSASEFMLSMTQEARIGLGMETLKTSSIPTIQALLQQSAREVVFGRSSQGWLYGGMAFRMAFDMGIHLPSDKLQTIVKSLSAEDIEIRKRLFWSCYAWDKVLSLYLGRMPGFTPPIEEVPLSFMDDYSDSDHWFPYYGATPGPEVASQPKYEPVPGYVVSCFQQLCRLCIILNDLMQNIYSSDAALRRNDEDNPVDARNATESPYVRISRDLQYWWSSLPLHLKVHPDQMPAVAPPVHIMSLNLLYHATLILLNRPVLQGSRDDAVPSPSRAYPTCVAATAAIHGLVMLLANTYGLSHVSYLNAYCVYTAATIAVVRLEHELKPGEDHNVVLHNIGLPFFLEVLQRTSVSMPALERSNAIIRKKTNAVIERHKTTVPPAFLPSPSCTTPLSGYAATQSALAQPTVFQALSEPALTHGGFHAHVPASQPTPVHQHRQSLSNMSVESFLPNQSVPIQWQSDMRTSLSFEPSQTMAGPNATAFSDDWLPAFPGQQFPVGSEHSFGSGEVDTQSRMALLGFNLDPHPRLNPGDIDWTIMEGFDGGTVGAVNGNEAKFPNISNGI